MTLCSIRFHFLPVINISYIYMKFGWCQSKDYEELKKL